MVTVHGFTVQRFRVKNNQPENLETFNPEPVNAYEFKEEI